MLPTQKVLWILKEKCWMVNSNLKPKIKNDLFKLYICNSSIFKYLNTGQNIVLLSLIIIFINFHLLAKHCLFLVFSSEIYEGFSDRI